METTAKLYSYNYGEVRTYMWAALFVVCNLVLPRLFHLIPQGGIIFSPLSLVIMAGSYKLGWRVGLLAALASPLVNHSLTGMPAWGVLPLMTFKLATLALVTGFAARYFKRVSILILIAVILVDKLIGGLGELALTGGMMSTINDFTIGYPGLLLQMIGTYLICKYA